MERAVEDFCHESRLSRWGFMLVISSKTPTRSCPSIYVAHAASLAPGDYGGACRPRTQFQRRDSVVDPSCGGGEDLRGE